MPANSKKPKLSNQTGGTYKPAEYHGSNSGRYSATPAGLVDGAYGKQVAVSQGVIHDGVAGPNLAWSGGNMLTGGGKMSSRKQTGGTYKPAEYHGANSGRYSATPAGLVDGAYGKQVAVSQGVIHDGVAGPNLAWSGGNMLTGGGKMSSKKGTKLMKKTRKQSKRRYNKKNSPAKKVSGKQRGAGCGCNSSTRKGW